MKKRIFISTILAFISGYTLADISTAPYAGRVTGQALVSNSLGVFSGDAMLPTLGNQNGFVYLDANGADSTSTSWLVSPGLGFRDIINNVIYGAYGYGDYQVSNLGGNFWVINPGIEVMSPHWDGHVNGYVALNRTSQNGPQAFADTIGITQGELPTGNTFEDTQILPVAVIGSGLDAAAGYSFPYKKICARAFPWVVIIIKHRQIFCGLRKTLLV